MANGVEMGRIRLVKDIALEIVDGVDFRIASFEVDVVADEDEDCRNKTATKGETRGRRRMGPKIYEALDQRGRRRGRRGSGVFDVR